MHPFFDMAGASEGFTIDVEAAQTLMDSLWNCGIRPTEGSGSAGSLAATQAHLATVKEILTQVLPAAIAQPQ